MNVSGVLKQAGLRKRKKQFSKPPKSPRGKLIHSLTGLIPQSNLIKL